MGLNVVLMPGTDKYAGGTECKSIRPGGEEATVQVGEESGPVQKGCQVI